MTIVGDAGALVWSLYVTWHGLAFRAFTKRWEVVVHTPTWYTRPSGIRLYCLPDCRYRRIVLAVGGVCSAALTGRKEATS